MGLRWWQMLPIGPTGYGDSPYQSPSTFAGNPMLISLDDLVADGWLEAAAAAGDFDEDKVDFGAVIAWKQDLLDRATARFVRSGASESDEFGAFLRRHRTTWLDDFALFTALKRAHGLRPWWEWEAALAHRERSTMKSFRQAHASEIHAIEVEQFLFDRQFRRLREVCRQRDVSLIGDIPIFVAHDSADVWAHRDLYLLEPDGSPTVVAGVPPDYFSKTGQRWGNPLYDWDAHIRSDFVWWTERLRRMFDLFDVVRIDHFRGFVASWHIPASEPTAVRGTWVPAPGRALFDHLDSTFPSLPVIAEDLGLITPEVEQLRDDFGLPGMKVLQFGFGTESAHAIEQFRPHVVAYTGTHDNDTARGWFTSQEPGREAERNLAMQLLGSDGTEFAWELIRGVFASVAATAIAPLQDMLDLGSEARMNIPGVEAGNWSWRFRWDAVTSELVDRMAALVHETGR